MELALVPVLYPPRRLTARLVYVLLIGIQTIAGLMMIAISGIYLRGSGATPATLVIVAAELPHLLPIRWVWLWVAANTVALTAVVAWVVDGWADVITFPLAMAGFQAFAVTSSYLALRETRAREGLARANTELHAAHALLAEQSRTEERLRISRDLHDTLGHHLTALSLQLDVASRLSDGKAAAHVRQAHAITRLLLSDVRDVVGTLRETRPAGSGAGHPGAWRWRDRPVDPSRFAGGVARRGQRARRGAAAVRAGNHHQRRASRAGTQPVDPDSSLALTASPSRHTTMAAARRSCPSDMA